MYFQAFESVDGAETLARTWPTTFTFMSGNPTHLETELLIGWDTLAHSLQKLLNVNNVGHTPKITFRDYHPETGYFNQSESSSSKNGPPMCEPMFHQEILYSFSSTDEESRKSYRK